MRPQCRAALELLRSPLGQWRSHAEIAAAMGSHYSSHGGVAKTIVWLLRQQGAVVRSCRDRGYMLVALPSGEGGAFSGAIQRQDTARQSCLPPHEASEFLPRRKCNGPWCSCPDNEAAAQARKERRRAREQRKQLARSARTKARRARRREGLSPPSLPWEMGR